MREADKRRMSIVFVGPPRGDAARSRAAAGQPERVARVGTLPRAGIEISITEPLPYENQVNVWRDPSLAAQRNEILTKYRHLYEYVNTNYQTEEVRGDGNCMFYSLSKLFYGDTTIKHTNDIRKTLCDVIKQDPVLMMTGSYEGFHGEWLSMDECYKDKVWGNNQVIAAACKHFRRRIVILFAGRPAIRNKDGAFQLVNKPVVQTFTEDFNEKDPVWFLFSEKDVHFKPYVIRDSRARPEASPAKSVLADAAEDSDSDLSVFDVGSDSDLS